MGETQAKLVISQAIIVEGKYDKIKLDSMIQGVILVTNGYRIFKDPEKMALIRYFAAHTGIIILTDSDRAGFKIRGYLKGCVPEGKITHVYIPDIFGKDLCRGKAGCGGHAEKRAGGGVPAGGRADRFCTGRDGTDPAGSV